MDSDARRDCDRAHHEGRLEGQLEALRTVESWLAGHPGGGALRALVTLAIMRVAGGKSITDPASRAESPAPAARGPDD
jgi:hypothetical protein